MGPSKPLHSALPQTAQWELLRTKPVLPSLGVSTSRWAPYSARQSMLEMLHCCSQKARFSPSRHLAI